MASTGSICSGSPESKSTLDTPENGPYDNFFNLPTLSDLRLSPIDDSYAEWKALPSRLLESPPLGSLDIRFRGHSNSFTKLGESIETQGVCEAFATDLTLGSDDFSTVDTRTEGDARQIESSSPYSAIYQHYLEHLDGDKRFLHSTYKLNGNSSISNQSLLDLSKEPTEFPTFSTRHLKVFNISPSTSFIMLYKILQV